MTNYIERYWRDAKPEDAIKEPPMVARFRNNDTQQWHFDKLNGIDRGEEKRWICGSWCTVQCQVYDAPDPGEGWRLIDPDKDTKQEGDEYLSSDGTWAFAGLYYFLPQASYRRRIEQPKPKPKYVPFAWEDREQLRGRWLRCVDVADNEWMITSMYIGASGELRANGTHADRLLSGFIFLDTGEPVGKKVTQ